jgi:hypothetical protein
MKTRILTLAPGLLLALVGCRPQEGLTAEQAAEAKDEMQTETQTEALTSKPVEISTNFTIGGAAQQAATELQAFIKSQWACAEATISGNTLTVQYGVHGSCAFNSYQSFSGTEQVTITKNDASDVEVDHVWTNLSNGVVEVSGTAHVTWNLADPSRHIQHDLHWTRISDGRTGEGKGDRVQKPLDGDLTVGFTEQGDRSWTGKSGTWSLAEDGLQMRWEDPVPQAGSVTLDTPFDKTVSVAFARVNTSTIKVTLEGPRGDFSFDVSK